MRGAGRAKLVAAWLLAGSACGGSCPIHTGDALVDGTGSVTLTDLSETFTQGSFTWLDNPPDYAGSGSFVFLMGAADIRCTDVPWSAFQSTQPVALATLTCTVDLYPNPTDASLSFSASLTAGTLRSMPALDKGVGTLDVWLDIPATSVTLAQDDGGAQHPAVVQASALHGRSTWGQTSCGDSSCGGINPAI